MSIRDRFLAATAVAAILGWAAGSTQAAPVTFFGEDLNPSGSPFPLHFRTPHETIFLTT
jgi:hypothetical protein